MNESTNLDFHLNVEETKDGGAYLNGQWNVHFAKSRFELHLDLVTDTKTSEAISFYSDVQRTITDKIRSWAAFHGQT